MEKDNSCEKCGAAVNPALVFCEVCGVKYSSSEYEILDEMDFNESNISSKASGLIVIGVFVIFLLLFFLLFLGVLIFAISETLWVHIIFLSFLLFFLGIILYIGISEFIRYTLS